MSIKAYKGFNKDMTCRGFQFEEGKTYHEDEAKLCESGFHACLDPLDCFTYYGPAHSVYHEVDLDDVTDKKSNDSKICGKTVKINAKLDIAGIVKAQIEVIMSEIKNKAASTQGKYSAASTQGDCSAASTQGNFSAASTQGYRSAASTQGDFSAASTQGDCSAASTQGNFSAASTQGYCSAASTQGYCSAASTQGKYSAASTQGYCSAASTQGYCSAASTQGYGSVGASTGNENSVFGCKGSISIGWGKNNKCKGELGSYIVLIERGEWDGEKYPQIGEPMLKKVDGKTIKPDTWYELKNGKFVEVEEETE